MTPASRDPGHQDPHAGALPDDEAGDQAGDDGRSHDLYGAHDVDAQPDPQPAASSGRGGLFQDSVRKVLVGGASALLMTEENIRNAISDVRLPKDAMSFLLQQTDRTRREVMRVVSKEVKNAVDKVDLRGELRRALVGLNVDVRATVRFREDGQPGVQMTQRVRRRRRHAAQGSEGGPAAAAASAPAAPTERASSQASHPPAEPPPKR